MEQKPHNILSLGMGVQSVAIYFMSAIGELPLIDYAVFSNPGKEGIGTMKYLDFLLDWQVKNNGPQIIVKSERNLYNDLLKNKTSSGKRVASVPAFTKNEDGTNGILRRQCTGEYKIAVVDQAIREVHGLKPRERNIPTNVWKGISIEEVDRMSIPEAKWKTFIYPLTGYGIPHPSVGKYFQLKDGAFKRMNRNDLKSWYRSHGLPIPPKSACIFCPYQSDSRWAQMKTQEPEDFADAVKVDEAIRDSSKRGVEQPIYLHRSCKPLGSVDFDPNSEIEFGECSGTCNT